METTRDNKTVQPLTTEKPIDEAKTDLLNRLLQLRVALDSYKLLPVVIEER